MGMAYETIDFKADGSIARITLNRPDRLNSFTVQMHEELRDALASLGEARVLVLAGAGRKNWSARTSVSWFPLTELESGNHRSA